MHLKSLTIKNFRGIDSLEIPSVGRVTLITGLNGVGKTTVLDAIQVYAARGRVSALTKILSKRNELADIRLDPDEESEPEFIRRRIGDRYFVNWSALFNGRNALNNATLSIGPSNAERTLEISAIPSESEDHTASPSLFDDWEIDREIQLFQLEATFGLKRRYRISSLLFGENIVDHSSYNIKLFRRTQKERIPESIDCTYLGPNVIGAHSSPKCIGSG